MGLTAIDAKIERLEKEIKNAKASRTATVRKERNGQLIAFGVLIEQLYNTSTPEQRENLKKKAVELLDDRNKARVLKGFDRLATALAEVQKEEKGEDETRPDGQSGEEN